MSYTEFDAMAREYASRNQSSDQPSPEKLQEMKDRMARKIRLKRYQSG